MKDEAAFTISQRVRAPPKGPTSPNPVTTTTFSKSSIPRRGEGFRSLSGGYWNFMFARGVTTGPSCLTGPSNTRRSSSASRATARRISDVSKRPALSSVEMRWRSPRKCRPPFRSATMGFISESFTISGDSRPTRLKAISCAENVRAPNSSIPSAMMLLPDIRPVPRVHLRRRNMVKLRSADVFTREKAFYEIYPITAPMIVRPSEERKRKQPAIWHQTQARTPLRDFPEVIIIFTSTENSVVGGHRQHHCGRASIVLHDLLSALHLPEQAQEVNEHNAVGKLRPRLDVVDFAPLFRHGGEGDDVAEVPPQPVLRVVDVVDEGFRVLNRAAVERDDHQAGTFRTVPLVYRAELNTDGSFAAPGDEDLTARERKAVPRDARKSVQIRRSEAHIRFPAAGVIFTAALQINKRQALAVPLRRQHLLHVAEDSANADLRVRIHASRIPEEHLQLPDMAV
ncbi:MAG: hypothetical protein BJ554DRAFT_1746 [Olpidium bornovanus]|uniref:Uncharacterized protein n=1 Tax=Olpidium bornovanus TaxID=278681 RepID=A0A8H7ZS91_9FUNG|nr:MAG: hypothetical protein BJ554DRAFT_1746 [Olpidium bornovanus]